MKLLSASNLKRKESILPMDSHWVEHTGERGESEIRRSLKRDAVERNRAGGRPTEAEIDRILEHTFPASDPPSWTLGLEPRDAHAAQQRLAASSHTNQKQERQTET